MTAAPEAISGALLRSYLEELPLNSGLPLGVSQVDELVTNGGVRDEQQLVASSVERLGVAGLLAAQAEARRHVADDGVYYGSPTTVRPRRTWEIDPLPVVIPAAEWASLEAGLTQRAYLLNRVLRDLYGEGRLLSSRLVPAEIVLGHGGFIPQSHPMPTGAPGRLALVSADLGRDGRGRWSVIADRTAAPSGAGYAMANRRIVTKAMAWMHRGTPLVRLREFFHLMTVAMRELAPGGQASPRVVLLSSGSASETAFEQAFIATLCGFSLAEGEDLTMRDGRVWLRAADRLEPVDVLLRRVDASFADPLELRAESQLGVPGLIEAIRRGTVSVANPMGAGVLENPALMALLPRLARELLGEDLLLESAPTWWCGEPVGRSHVLAHLDRLVVKPIHRGARGRVTTGWTLAAAERDQLRRAIEAAPWRYVGQEHLPMSTAPVVTPSGLRPRPMVLRTFGVGRSDGYHFMAGGLARVARHADELVISNASGALAKDVWVVGEQAPGAAVAETATRAPLTLATTVPSSGPAPRVADNLYWVGRYAHRAEGVTRVLRVATDLADDHLGQVGTPGAAALAALLDAAAALTVTEGPPATQGPEAGQAYLRSLVADSELPGTVAYAVGRLIECAHEVRDHMSGDAWVVLSRLERAVTSLAEEDELRAHLVAASELLLAVFGIFAENMVRDATWAFLDAGARIERAQQTLTLIRSTLTEERSPIVEAQVTESTLIACDSILTYRRRLASGEGPTAPRVGAYALLLADAANPRSVAYQLDRLERAMRLFGDDALAAEVLRLRDRIAITDIEALVESAPAEAMAVLSELLNAIRALSDKIGAAHFRRPAPQRTMAIDWSGGEL